MSTRVVAIAVTGVLTLALGNASTAEAQLLGGTKPLAVPVTGTVTGGGTFSGTLSIQSFAVQGGATVAVAAIAGAILGTPAGIGAQTGMRANVILPVAVSSALPITARRPAGLGQRGHGSSTCSAAATSTSRSAPEASST